MEEALYLICAKKAETHPSTSISQCQTSVTAGKIWRLV